MLRIRSLLFIRPHLSVDRIAQDLSVSRETVRRDVLELEAQGVLRRVHGGVVAIAPQTEPSPAVGQTIRAKEKRSIARAAAGLLEPGQTVFMDSGSTTTAVAEELASMAGLTIVTNGLNIGLKLATPFSELEERNHLVLLGGKVSATSACTYGETTVAEIHRFRADVALLSPVGVSREAGATSFEHHEAAIARAMVERSKRRIVLADHSKIGQTSRVVYAPMADIGILITDSASCDLPAFDDLCQANCELLVV
ncbi:transcriptional regulator, DeoR family [Variovorax sp. YR750]|nr:transcriptional regulator, DeoR family [Variovorax sp. YR750]